MIRNRIIVKSIAVFLLLETVVNVTAPSVLLALTSGPTAPEATSFEPVDTTDMVNTVTGDFVYSLPLLEVPGPSGGYPLSLSYHAGIQPGLDASWVGLGFSLNPGSVNRMVNGVPDDFDAARTSNRIFWEGGETTVKTYGVSIGLGNFATVSSGLVFANDTYRGRGVGGFVGGSAGISRDSRLSIRGRVGLSPYGGQLSGSVGAGFSGGGVGASVGINTSGRVDVGMGNTFVSTGLSIDTKGGAVDVSSSIGGFSSSFNNSKSGKISSFSEGYSIDIPVYYGINIQLGRDYTRYWQDERETYENYGSLFMQSSDDSNSSLSIYDSYHLSGMNNIAEGAIPQKYLEGSFIDYDSYSVNAQGLGGSFRPYHYISSVSTQDVVDESTSSKEVLNYSIPEHSIGVHYRFVNDFSNRVLTDAPDIGINRTPESYSDPADPQPDYKDWKGRVNQAYGANGNVPMFFPYKSAVTGEEGFDGDTGNRRRLPNVPGSRDIEYFTNEEISDNAAGVRARGFIECDAKGFSRDYLRRGDSKGLLGAFVVTNSSGVRYHFSLPAYSSSESVYSQNKDTRDKVSFNNVEQRGKYAYTWYLTGMTGPDYVDRGPDGIADGLLNEYDWGYWVAFDYGLWTENFWWRNPAVGFRDDLDNRFQTFSKGKKELYYLNAVRTATHTALFIKELRADGKGECPLNDASVVTNGLSISFVDEGSFAPSKRTIRVSGEPGAPGGGSLEYSQLPSATLCLKSIMLFRNEDLGEQSFLNLSQEYNDRAVYTWAGSPRGDRTVITHYGEFVLDVNDIVSTSFPKDKVLREIDFGYDYSLAPGTLNSFDQAGALYDCEGCINYHPGDALTKDKLGKLTLKSLSFKGKGGAELLPPMKFGYEAANPASTSGTVLSADGGSRICHIANFNSNGFSEGDLLKIVQGDTDYYGYLIKNISTAEVKIVSDVMPLNERPVIVTQTKNPPYSDRLHDMWGYYKCDYKKTDDHNVDRLTSDISGRHTDVWCLRTIDTSLGSTITVCYEPDTYSKSILSENLPISLKLSAKVDHTTPPDAGGETPTSVFLESSLDATTALDFTKMYRVGDYVDLAGGAVGCSGSGAEQICDAFLINRAQIQEVSRNYIRMRFYIGYEALQSYYGCVMKVKSRAAQPGGGIRVSEIGVRDYLTESDRIVRYVYEFDGVSSGVTSYEPINISNLSSVLTEDAQVGYSVKSYLLHPFLKMMTLSRDVPAPAVYYGRVRVEERFASAGSEAISLPTYTEYEFQTFNEGLIDVAQVSSTTVSSVGTHRDQGYSSISTSKKVLRDFTSRLGNLKSVTLFNANGDPVTKTVYHFLHDAQTDSSFDGNSSQYKQLLGQYRNQGQIEEVFNHGRLVKKSSSTNVLQGLVTKREVYPTVPTGTTSIQYKTGLKTTSRTLGFDFYSGQPTEVLSDDGYGNYFVTHSTPAYRVYPSMGLKAFYEVDNVQNKHMLDQGAYTAVYKVNPSNFKERQGLVSASAQTWTDRTAIVDRTDLNQDGHQPGVWRKSAAYSFIGEDAVALRSDGFYPAANVSPFNAWNWGSETPAGWQRNSEITLYDVQSHALEARDINGNYAATRMLSDHARVAATAINARYNEYAYSGAEDFDSRDMSGNAVLRGGGDVNTQYHHTGSHSLSLAGGQTGFESVLTLETKNYNRSIHVSFWIHQPTLQPITVQYQFTSGRSLTSPVAQAIDLQKARRAGDWLLCETDIAVSKTTIASDSNLIVRLSNSGVSTIYVDDYRIHPVDAAVTSYVYNSWGELSHILDNTNLYTEYRYDVMGRLTSTYKETFQAGYGNGGVAKTGDIIYNSGRNNVYHVSLTSSFDGPSGQLSPSGVTAVEQGRDVIYNIYEKCSESDLLSLHVDGVPLNLSLGETTLFDGTKVLLQGNRLIFKGVLANHTLSAQFRHYGIGIVECHLAQSTTGPCYDGSFDYAYYDACGVLGDRIHASGIMDIPADLRGQAPTVDFCKSLNGPTPCGGIIQD